MQVSDLEQEIEAYERLLPSIDKPCWALVANLKLVDTFSDFATAARYARENFGSKEVLIRHTGERTIETAPFLHVHLDI